MQYRYQDVVQYFTVWRGDRVVDGTCLENKRGATYREFESRPLRQSKNTTLVVVFLLWSVR